MHLVPVFVSPGTGPCTGTGTRPSAAGSWASVGLFLGLAGPVFWAGSWALLGVFPGLVSVSQQGISELLPGTNRSCAYNRQPLWKAFYHQPAHTVTTAPH